jgi:hypothetical protein
MVACTFWLSLTMMADLHLVWLLLIDVIYLMQITAVKVFCFLSVVWGIISLGKTRENMFRTVNFF